MWQDVKPLVLLQHDEMQSHLTFALGMVQRTPLERWQLFLLSFDSAQDDSKKNYNVQSDPDFSSWERSNVIYKDNTQSLLPLELLQKHTYSHRQVYSFVKRNLFYWIG